MEKAAQPHQGKSQAYTLTSGEVVCPAPSFPESLWVVVTLARQGARGNHQLASACKLIASLMRCTSSLNALDYPMCSMQQDLPSAKDLNPTLTSTALRICLDEANRNSKIIFFGFEAEVGLAVASDLLLMHSESLDAIIAQGMVPTKSMDRYAPS